MKTIIWKITYKFKSIIYGLGKERVAYIDASNRKDAIDKLEQRSTKCEISIIDLQPIIKYK